MRFSGFGFHAQLKHCKGVQANRSLLGYNLVLLLVLVATNVRSVFCEAYRLKLYWVVVSYTRRQARYDLVGIWCNEIWNRVACTSYNIVLLVRRDGLWREGYAMTGGWEAIYTVKDSVLV